MLGRETKYEQIITVYLFMLPKLLYLWTSSMTLTRHMKKNRSGNVNVLSLFMLRYNSECDVTLAVPCIRREIKVVNSFKLPDLFCWTWAYTYKTGNKLVCLHAMCFSSSKTNWHSLLFSYLHFLRCCSVRLGGNFLRKYELHIFANTNRFIWVHPTNTRTSYEQVAAKY